MKTKEANVAFNAVLWKRAHGTTGVTFVLFWRAPLVGWLVHFHTEAGGNLAFTVSVFSYMLVLKTEVDLLFFKTTMFII